MTDIVTVTPGNYTPGAQTTLDFAAALINATWNQANTKMADFTTKMDGVDALLASSPVADVTADVANTTPVLEPVVSIPTSIDTSAVLTTFDTKYLELVQLLVDKFTVFQSTYFPNESAVYAQAETWVSDALANPDQAIPVAVAAQLLTDDSDRAYAESVVATDALLATFAARRFPLPPGAAASGVLQIQQKVQDTMAESSRKLMMATIEQIKFAVQQTMAMRQQAMASAVQYIQAMASGPEMASRLVGIGYDAQSKLISSVSGFYNARTDAQRLVNQAEQFNVTTKLAKDEKNQAVDMTLVEERIKAMLAEAQTIGQTAAAMFNNLHASSGTSYGVNGT